VFSTPSHVHGPDGVAAGHSCALAAAAAAAAAARVVAMATQGQRRLQLPAQTGAKRRTLWLQRIDPQAHPHAGFIGMVYAGLNARAPASPRVESSTTIDEILNSACTRPTGTHPPSSAPTRLV